MITRGLLHNLHPKNLIKSIEVPGTFQEKNNTNHQRNIIT